MAEVTLTIAGRAHRVGCRDGDEPRLQLLGRRLDAHSQAALRASGGQGAERLMLYIALMIADELVETERAPSEGISSALLDRIADRLEAVASALEESLPSA